MVVTKYMIALLLCILHLSAAQNCVFDSQRQASCLNLDTAMQMTKNRTDITLELGLDVEPFDVTAAVEIKHTLTIEGKAYDSER